MNDSSHEIRLRIEWCRRMHNQAGTQDQKEGWRAEEAGLLDALLGINRLEISRSCHPSRIARYQLGLEDGRTLVHLRTEPDAQPGARQAVCDNTGGRKTIPIGARIRFW